MPNKERDSAIAMELARRAYLYRLLHVAFGSRPTVANVSKIFSKQGASYFEFVGGELARGAFDRSGQRSIGLDGRSLAAYADDATAFIEKASDRVDDPVRLKEFAGDLLSDYDKLFHVPGDLFVPPWESPYTGKESMVFQESTLDVRSFYHEASFKLQAERRFPDDHIAAMMDFMGRLSQDAYEQYADGYDDKALHLLATQGRFSDQHLLTWVDRFAGKVIEKDVRGYFGALAGGMAAFVREDRTMIVQLEAELAA